VLTQHIQQADLIITTAAIPGRPWPKLVSKAQVAGSLRPSYENVRVQEVIPFEQQRLTQLLGQGVGEAIAKV
jgi:hypothetical protein